jgi:hypothetical protein
LYSRSGIDSWIKFRFFIGCEGTSESFFCWPSKATMQDYNEVRCETDCRLKNWTLLLYFFYLVFRRIVEWLLIQSWVYWESIVVEILYRAEIQCEFPFL